jgi:hypothetical protein
MLQAHFMEWPPSSLDVCPRENPPVRATEGEPERHPGKERAPPSLLLSKADRLVFFL